MLRAGRRSCCSYVGLPRRRRPGSRSGAQGEGGTTGGEHAQKVGGTADARSVRRMRWFAARSAWTEGAGSRMCVVAGDIRRQVPRALAATGRVLLNLVPGVASQGRLAFQGALAGQGPLALGRKIGEPRRARCPSALADGSTLQREGLQGRRRGCGFRQAGEVLCQRRVLQRRRRLRRS